MVHLFSKTEIISKKHCTPARALETLTVYCKHVMQININNKRMEIHVPIVESIDWPHIDRIPLLPLLHSKTALQLHRDNNMAISKYFIIVQNFFVNVIFVFLSRHLLLVALTCVFVQIFREVELK